MIEMSGPRPSVLCDVDLVRRLRLRGLARGPAQGIDDLEAALRIAGDAAGVGVSVEAARAAGIEQIAQTVTTWALSRGELDRAQSAAQLAHRLLPDADGPLLDRASVLEARGRAARAADLLHGLAGRGPTAPPSEPPTTAATEMVSAPDDERRWDTRVRRVREWLGAGPGNG